MGARYTDEFRTEAVRLASSGDQSVAAVARDLGVSAQQLHRWIRQHEVDQGAGPAGALTTAEREELRQLRRENKRLKMEREILKKATAFFAKESE